LFRKEKNIRTQVKALQSSAVGKMEMLRSTPILWWATAAKVHRNQAIPRPQDDDIATPGQHCGDTCGSLWPTPR